VGRKTRAVGRGEMLLLEKSLESEVPTFSNSRKRGKLQKKEGKDSHNKKGGK